ncbi:TetR/AcrR family transcriptional regulator [Caminicella sporogenes]|uniref:TetR/AcrR family transcriptional regulator n=1 Tax=Caminicella sporogenes TaxID=166485 RepID=UPI002540479E|nr:TetR/AcrR family transcriptional regulator [Caminicella sporogenes]WIF94043.1 TetR/AcrR family transcriptional regulator [Caminicella sporogenes]
MNKKEIQRKRMMGYFIEAANQIIENEGIDFVTIRKVADIAGYNSATLYNYFKDLEHLLFFSSMKYLKDYALNLPNYINGAKNALDKFLRIWKCFCYNSFKKPKIYYKIFFDKYSNTLNDAVKEYYSIFPEELGNQPQELLTMLLEKNIYMRDMALLEACAEEGFFKKEDLPIINEMILLIYQGMLLRVLNNQINCTIDEAVEKTLKYIKQTLKSFEVKK